jgi:thymidine kinase
MMMNGVRVVAAGLDKDYLNRDFGPMRALKNLATNQIQVFAKCNVCGGKAQYTYRQSDSKELVLVGHNDAYQARCLEHWEEGMKGRL